jgi:hypothetical protein
MPRVLSISCGFVTLLPRHRNYFVIRRAAFDNAGLTHIRNDGARRSRQGRAAALSRWERAMSGIEDIVGMLGHGFARDVVAHWLDIRGADLVPQRRALDPACFARALPRIWLGDYVAPGELRFLLAGNDIRNRVDDPLTRVNFFDFVHPTERPEAIERVRLMFALPCAVHYRYRIFLQQECVEEIEALVLPLARAPGQAPDLSITVTQRTGGRGLTEFDDRGARVVRGTTHRFVDIGAGIPAAA